MAKYRQVHCSFWSDPDVESFTMEEKLFYLYLMTNSHTMQCGISTITKRRMSSESGISLKGIDTLLIRFQSLGKIRYNEETNELAMRNWMKYNPNTSPKVKVCIDNELAMVKDRVLIPYVYGMDTQTQEYKKNNIQEGEEKNTSRFLSAPEISVDLPQEEFSPEDERIFELFVGLIRQRDSGFQTPNKAAWISDINKIHRIDKREYSQIEEVVRWCQADSFWFRNIMSGKKLREKFNQLVAGMDQYKIKNNGKPKPTSLNDAIKAGATLHSELVAIEESFRNR